MMRAIFRYSGNLSEAQRYIGADGRPGDPIISRYHMHTAEVVRPLGSDEADEEVGPMFLVRFDDGHEAEAFEDELEPVK